MRFVALLCLALLAGCPGSFEADLNAAGDDGSGSGSGAGLSPECSQASDCTPEGPKCCDCPTHAVPVSDPSAGACSDVDCQTPSCGSPMQAACDAGHCVLECAPVACAADLQCPDGLATDANGCLTCECAVPVSNDCSLDTDCARVRADCCGCENGGNDTAVPTNQVAAYDAQLMCPTNPSCVPGNTCSPDLAPRCVQGGCALVEGVLPVNACGRTDLPVCAAGEACTVNANDQATMLGVGVCQP